MMCLGNLLILDLQSVKIQRKRKSGYILRPTYEDGSESL